MGIPAPTPTTAAVVTGASSGIGADIARELSRRGHTVVLVARRTDRLRALADELPTRAEVVACDLADGDARAALLPAIAKLGLTVDVLVNNAGLGTTGPLAGVDPDQHQKMITVDVEALADLTTRALPGMVERGRGAILNTASTAAFQPLPGQAGYAACKAFVLSFGQALAAELTGTGVTVTTLCPGPVDTEFGQVADFSREEMEAGLPTFMWVSSADVAKAGIDGLAKGRPVVIPGRPNAIAARFGAVAPRRVLLPLLLRRYPAMKRSAR